MSEQEYTTLYTEVENYIKTICNLLKVEETKIEVKSNYPHNRKERITPGDRAIYMFYFPAHKHFLKIGKASNNPCFQNRHYKYDIKNKNWKSSLAKSLWQDETFKKENLKNIRKEEIETWMLENLERINIIIHQEIGDNDKLTFTTNLLEACLQYEYQPTYEGHKSQRNNREKEEMPS